MIKFIDLDRRKSGPLTLKIGPKHEYIVLTALYGRELLPLNFGLRP